MRRKRGIRMKKERILTLDIIRVIAVLSVISVHFFLNTGFYNTEIRGETMFAAITARTMFMVCVPLFLLLTGYLMKNKKVSIGYYTGIGKVIFVYLLSTAAMLLFRKFWLNEPVTVFSAFENIFTFQQYSWYVEMYIGLFAVIPFLNVLYGNLDRRGKKLLISVMVFVTVLPTTFNSFDWFAGLTAPDVPPQPFAFKIFPDFWTNLYPVTYYFIGAFIGENREAVKDKKIFNVGVFLAAVILFGAYDYYLCQHRTFIWNGISDWGGVQDTVLSVLLFCTVLRTDFISKPALSSYTANGGGRPKRTVVIPRFAARLISGLSEISFGTYLLSWIADNITYPVLCENIEGFHERFPYFFVMVPLNFCIASVMSAVVFAVYRAFSAVIKNIKSKKKTAGSVSPAG